MKLEEIVEALKSKGLEEEEIKKVLIELKEEIVKYCGEGKTEEEPQEEKEEEFIKRVYGI